MKLVSKRVSFFINQQICRNCANLKKFLIAPNSRRKLGHGNWSVEKRVVRLIPTCCALDSTDWIQLIGFSRLDLADWSQVILRFKSSILTRPELANERSSATRKLCNDEAPFAAFRG
jgi:hypothetical protein